MGDLHDVFDEMVRESPKSGMSFDSAERLYEAYNLFAKEQGFCAVCRSISSSSKYVVMSCDRFGKLDYKKHTKKTDCRAHINAIRRDSGKWEVSTVHLDHNHELDPNMSALMAGHRSLPMSVKRQLEANDIAGVPICKSVRLAQVQAGGPRNLGANARDCRNYINERRRLRLGEGDAHAIHKLFRTLQGQDARFFHLMDIDEDFRLPSVMWIHPRSIAAYQDFHDVVSFDTTYLINQYQMPLATVVGVNHHHQSILLGCALLAREHAESFKWFFSNWVEAIGGVHPTAILTDQCESIGVTESFLLS
ncbi:protein FAR-RED IMPAIRED RESPONSE 1-like [Salvia miltiorrhiza]|uniref:protein FAR-RED IMPAIRED RESPONSE 1-like n=1 Tax=Salvia miltiorrhiza TaxID=226208 RepID=UPI0025ACEC06|nr:protein FAR-RED IMPAIRED RESPONSE 1-like [Salvia miltiorrhiza]